MLVFQEHIELQKRHTDLLKSVMWRNGHYNVCRIIDGVCAMKNHKVLGGKNGVSIMLHVV